VIVRFIATSSAVSRPASSKSLSKEERKKLRKQYVELAVKQEHRGAGEGVEGASHPPRYSRAYLSQHLKAVHEVFWIAHSHEMNPDYSPRSLAQLDDDLPENLAAEAESRGTQVDSKMLWAFHAGLGSYFGEVLVRNLGGEWRYPNRLAAILSSLLNRPDILYGHWYVMIGKLKVRVFQIAYLREAFGKERASLLKAYEKIATASERTHF
jgi:vacuolar-type H+-ATPase subunit E/Vma4